MKKAIILVLVLVMVAALFAACTTAPSQAAEVPMAKEDKGEETKEDMTEGHAEEPMEAEAENGLVVYDFDGNPVKLSGERTYLKAWASWCTYCIQGMPELEELFAEEQDFRMITIVSPGVNGEKNEADFIEWFNNQGYEIDVYFDNGGTVMNELGVQGYPTSFYMAADGTVFGARPGHNDNDFIKATMAGQ